MAEKDESQTGPKGSATGRAHRQARYLVGQKLSDYQMEKLIQAYAESIVGKKTTAKDAAERVGYSKNTAATIFQLLRKRLTEIRYFPAPEDFMEFLAEADKNFPSYFFDPTMTRLASRLAPGIRGVPPESHRHMVAEAIFSAQNPDLTSEALVSAIKLAVKITGPLNRPPQNVAVWNERRYILAMQAAIDKLRRIKRTHPARAAYRDLAEPVFCSYGRSFERR
ncbi:hypothetical protein ACQW02_06740 [Humitalea sp. 24SJ18S-53]|uniref:hypothetical protein n=1 Tax=Humitalea sp. 24SJ18S-53 TaxID=3422307 RepID=UPI003D67982E